MLWHLKLSTMLWHSTTNHFLLIRHSSARSFISIINIIYSNSNIPSTSQRTIEADADKHPNGHKHPERHSLANVYLRGIIAVLREMIWSCR